MTKYDLKMIEFSFFGGKFLLNVGHSQKSHIQLLFQIKPNGILFKKDQYKPQ